MVKPVGEGMAKPVWLFRGAPILAAVLFLEAYVFLKSFAFLVDSDLYPFLAALGPIMFLGVMFLFIFHRPFTALVYAEIGWVYRLLTLSEDEEEAAELEAKLYREVMTEIAAEAASSDDSESTAGASGGTSTEEE